MRIVLRSLDNLTTSFEDADVDNSPPLDTYAVPMPAGCGDAHRYYDFEGTRRDEDAAGEVVRVYRERKPAPVIREVSLRQDEAGKVTATFAQVQQGGREIAS